MDLQNEQEHEGASFEAYFRDPASAADSPLAWAVSQRSAVLDALRGLFSGPPAVVQLRVWCFMELVSVPHGRISREDLNQLFHLLLPQALDNVLKRFRDVGLLVWDATSQDYSLSILARQVHGLLAPLTQATGDDDDLAPLLAQVAGAQALVWQTRASYGTCTRSWLGCTTTSPRQSPVVPKRGYVRHSRASSERCLWSTRPVTR